MTITYCEPAFAPYVRKRIPTMALTISRPHLLEICVMRTVLFCISTRELWGIMKLAGHFRMTEQDLPSILLIRR